MNRSEILTGSWVNGKKPSILLRRGESSDSRTVRTNMTELMLPKSRKRTERQAEEIAFAQELEAIQQKIGFRVSSRGWCYQLEGFGLINKDQFNQAENAINKLRKNGLLPIDFTSEEQGRQFSGIEWPDRESPEEFLKGYLEAALECETYYTPDWWDDEEYYIQIVVEKIDLKTLFEPVCKEFHIPIATSSGWASMLMRAKYAARFRLYENKGYKCVLLYCGDFDPAGLQISKFLKKNLYDLMNIRWDKGARGYDPSNLIIERFGLEYDFIEDNNLSWINNLLTGSGRNLADPSHPDHYKPFVQDYLAQYGARKCEANALVINPESGRQLARDAIEKYLGDDATDRFKARKQAIIDHLEDFRADTGLTTAIQEAIDIIEAEE